MSLHRGRGRPKVARQEHDRGTPELQFKRAHHHTIETLDYCLERSIISQEQHWCGIHLRWLYTLRYGAPGVRAVDPTHISGIEVECDDPDWREAREQEYCEALNMMRDHHVHRFIINICVHNERPSLQNITKLTDGLNLLVTHWRKYRLNKK